MVKVRISGTKQEIRHFLKGFKKDGKYRLVKISGFTKQKYSDKYYFLYIDFERS